MKHSQSKSIFDFYGKPGFGKALPLSLQHILAMIMGAVTPPIILAKTLGLSGADSALLIQVALFFSGLSTLLQLYPIGKAGSRMPTIFGVGFAYLPTLLAVAKSGLDAGTAPADVVGSIMGAQIIGGVAMVIVGLFIKHIRNLFPPVVAGTVVLVIGLSLYNVAINYMAGGIGSPTFASGNNWLVALTTLGIVLICSQFGKGYFRLAAIIIGILAGYALAFFFGMVDFTKVADAGWAMVPMPMHFGLSFPIEAIIPMVIICIVNSVQTIGDLSATAVGGMNRELQDKEMEGGLVGNGITTLIGSLFGSLPTSSFSQNVGIVAMTKVISRYVLGVAAVFMILAGLLPKFSAVMTTIPAPVIGGATIIVFGMITMTGIQLLVKDELSSRNVTIAALSLAMAMGIHAAPNAVAGLPDMMKSLTNPVIIAALMSFILNIILPKKTLADEARDREAIEQEMNGTIATDSVQKKVTTEAVS
ncbi:uracil-xanthine permease family protein [Oceanisphaera avium]|uniref:Uracil permease n=1 Tax=Oceanisphaera avium TaxID=1903694 RepID=A0A1Y0CUU1_9GAMM|nr:nucleobase:cation symporter-2 family protein [Oceanisphaera avium]ART79110.1 uracil permease [Oceanisphaera avium]